MEQIWNTENENTFDYDTFENEELSAGWFEDWLESLTDEDFDEVLLGGQEAGIGLLCGGWD